MKKKRYIVFILIAVFGLTFNSCKTNNSSSDSAHPCLILTKQSVSDIKTNIKHLTLLKESFEEIKNQADNAIQEGVIVPIPKDPGGGYTHEQHKRNYLSMYNAGVCYQLTENIKYAEYVKQMLLEYATMYPHLRLHPQKKNQAPGKLFWQGLNESVWLVYIVQAYDCIYDYLSTEERSNIEENLFRKVVEFFTIEDEYSFNRIHNHGTWAAAGVGMTGMVLGDKDYIDMALYGTDKKGGAGYLKQIDELFSPDGFYTEGPYYQRYAIMPFILFAQALDNNYADIDIFNYKNGVLNKAVITLLQLTNESGKFFPINDAIKEKDFLSPELVYATNIVYSNTHNPELLSIAQKHHKVMISGEGLEVARDIDSGLEKNFERESLLISDGKDGDQGGIGILRGDFQNNSLEVVLKATSQGMGHGHFDRLSFSMYENGNEIIQDYGAARFLNVEQKQGGRYLPENNTWAKQTIAHNTMVINEESNFKGDLEIASNYNPKIIYSGFSTDKIKVIAVADSNCYQNKVLQRTMVLLSHNNSPYVIDLFRVIEKQKATYDYPIYYKGQVISTNFDYTKSTISMQSLGDKNGYQHLWKIAESKKMNSPASVTWMNKNRFYTQTFTVDNDSKIFLTQIGANDPEFNLRNEPGLLLRNKNKDNYTILSVIEPHGKYDPVNETVTESKTKLKDLRIIYQDKDITVIEIQFIDDTGVRIFLSHSNNQNHKTRIDNKTINWTGNYFLLSDWNNK